MVNNGTKSKLNFSVLLFKCNIRCKSSSRTQVLLTVVAYISCLSYQAFPQLEHLKFLNLINKLILIMCLKGNIRLSGENF